MSTPITEEISDLLKELIKLQTGFDETTNEFKRALKYFTTAIEKSHPTFASQQDIDKAMTGMCDKFSFHGCTKQADALRKVYANYMPENLPNSEKVNRLNVLQFLLSSSKTPTKYFLENPEAYQSSGDGEITNDEINWYEYLNEGIEAWHPKIVELESDQDFSDDAEDIDSLDATESTASTIIPKYIPMDKKLRTINFQERRNKLLETIQHSWYNDDYFCFMPTSHLREANIGILWEKHLADQFSGLIQLKSPSIITEYKVIREILFEMWILHSCVTFKLCGNAIKPNPAVTLASVRCFAFYEYLFKFIPHMEILAFFRDFNASIETVSIQSDNHLSGTYRSYNNSVQSILDPIYEKLCEIEDEVKRQEKTYTLLDLSNELNTVLEPVYVLKEIHNAILIERNDTTTPLQCATTLITRLHQSLLLCSSKLEQNLKMVLFLRSVYPYLSILDSWLMKNDLRDYYNEFVIEKYRFDGKKRENIEECKNNKFIRVFTEKALELGRNIHFLLQLRKYDVIGDYTTTIYEEFIETVLTKLREMNGISSSEPENDIHDQTTTIDDNDDTVKFIYPVISDKSCSLHPEFDKLENLVDTTDGFLMAAFSDFFIQQEPKKIMKKLSLFEQISNISTSLMPISTIFEDCLLNILEKRFTISGPMVKNILISEHMLDKQLDFLKRLYLFFEDTIFPFYRRLFAKTSSCKTNWNIWLTCHLHYIFMDQYPELSKNCIVQIQNNLSKCNSSLDVCNLMEIFYDVQWPLNIIINPKQLAMYNYTFRFLLKLKWALYTVNNLRFSDLTTKKSVRSSGLTGKIMHLKFTIINILNSLKHYIFGSIFSQNFYKFDLNFEKAHDLYSIVDTHEEFIKSIYSAITNFHEIIIEKKPDKNIFSCIELLKAMWTNPSHITHEGLENCKEIYQDFYNDISLLIFPVYIC